MLISDIKNKNITSRTITLLLIIVVCITIFRFSSENSEKSTNTSGSTIDLVININPYTKKLDITEKEKIKEEIETPIRKLAHFSIYTILGITTITHMCTYKISKYKRIGTSLMIGALYAISDEIHQLFVSGRSAQITDVLIDTVGVLFGICIVLAIQELVRKVRKSKKIRILW